MANSFGRRATEYVKDDEGFLSLVTPSPLIVFFEKQGKSGQLYDRLVKVIGTPGSGKTTLARLFEYRTLKTLERHEGIANGRELIAALTDCRVLEATRPLLLGCRIPLESEYRDFWELPYAEELRIGLMTRFMSARAVLSWGRHLRAAGHDTSSVRVVPKPDAHAALEEIGGESLSSVLVRAEEVERAIYRVVAALITPSEENLPAAAVAPYVPLDVIQGFQVAEEDQTLIPLVMFDDAHALHPDQLGHVQRWLARRELKVARWLLTRFDPLNAAETWQWSTGRDGADQVPGLTAGRDYIEIRLQRYERNTSTDRREFRRMSGDMADRLLAREDVFARRGLVKLNDLLTTDITPLPVGKNKELAASVDRLQAKYEITPSLRHEIELSVDHYAKQATATDVNADLKLAMLKILIERYADRVPQRSLFETLNQADLPRPVTPDASIAEGARILLLHETDRPYYFGLQRLSDASSENAEQFLNLAEILVSQAETHLVRGRSAMLTTRQQHDLLRERAGKIMADWDFPYVGEIRRLSNWMGKVCTARSLQPTAPLGGGANAVAIPMEEFHRLPKSHGELERVLRYGAAYNVFNFQLNARVKDRDWCVIELGGVSMIQHGLTLRRGGFVEHHADDLAKALVAEATG